MMTFDEHLGEYAELYALGVLDPEERQSVERHLAGCAACTREVGIAEETVVALDDATVPQVDPPAELGKRIAASASPAPSNVVAFQRPAGLGRQWALAASIALIVGLGSGVALDRGLGGSQATTNDEPAWQTIAASHFLHASFQPAFPGATPRLVAKVLYARDGSWLYVIVDSGAAGYRVVGRSEKGALDLGALRLGKSTSTLFVRTPDRPRSLQIVDQGRIIGSATLAALSK